MRIVAYKAIREFYEQHPEAKEPLDRWYDLTQKARWEDISELRETFPHADLIGGCICFNIAGNKYRLIVKINYKWQMVYIRFILSHAEYDRKVYQNDCC